MKILVVGLSHEHLSTIRQAIDWDSDWEFTPEVSYCLLDEYIPNCQFSKAWVFGVRADYQKNPRIRERVELIKKTLMPGASVYLL